MKKVHRKISVTGRVQGVGFRYFTKHRARELNISGWVRNEPDGSVTVVGSADTQSIKKFVDSLKEGPPSSRVEEVVELTPDQWELNENGFIVKY